MDNVTHGLAGLLMADAALQAIEPRGGRPASPRVRLITAVLGIAAAEFPDSDLVYSGPLVRMGPLGYLLHHRGHTHTLVWASISAIGLWFIACWWWRRRPLDETASSPVLPWLALAFAGTWSHLALDWTNSYGVHPFWPLNNRWYYGDAVFIVEPWLWIVAIPPLMLGARSRGGRRVLGLLWLVILLAGWLTGQVAPVVAVVLTAMGALWFAVLRALPARALAWSGMAAWIAVTAVFLRMSHTVRAQVLHDMVARGEQPIDIVLNPSPADPTCWQVLTIGTVNDGREYHLTSGVLGPFAWRPAAACAAPGVSSSASASASASLMPDTSRAVWHTPWSAPVDSLRALARAHCEVAAALRFMRAPAWSTAADGRVLLTDARYGARGGFSSLTVPSQDQRCSIAGRWVPPWTPPRADVLANVTN